MDLLREGLPCIAFIIACLVSFRALFTQREKQAHENQARLEEQIHQARGRPLGFRERVRQFHDNLLDSFRISETSNETGLPYPASGRFSPTFIMDIEGGCAAKHRMNTLQASTDQIIEVDAL